MPYRTSTCIAISLAALTAFALSACAPMPSASSGSSALHCEYHSTNVQVVVATVDGDMATVADIRGGGSTAVPVAEFPSEDVQRGQIYEATHKRIRSGTCLPEYYYIKRLVR